MRILGDIDIIGDTHGQYGALRYWVNHSDTPNLIHVGDFNAYKENIFKIIDFSELLSIKGKQIYVVRGNHDCPDLFDNGFYGDERGGITFLKDGSIAEWNGENILFNGGGVSLDRAFGKEGYDYWPEEPLKFKPVEKKIDHLVTHISLTEIHGNSIHHPFVLKYATNDADLTTDLYSEQQELKNWIDYLFQKGNKIQSWHYGHYHRSIRSVYNGIFCRCMDINEIIPFNRSEY